MKLLKLRKILCLIGIHEYRLFELIKIRTKNKKEVGCFMSHVCLKCHDVKMDYFSIIKEKEALDNGLRIKKEKNEIQNNRRLRSRS